MYFQLEVDYYSNEANKNKYTNFELIVLYLQRQLVILLLGLESTLLFGLVVT